MAVGVVITAKELNTLIHSGEKYNLVDVRARGKGQASGSSLEGQKEDLRLPAVKLLQGCFYW